MAAGFQAIRFGLFRRATRTPTDTYSEVWRLSFRAHTDVRAEHKREVEPGMAAPVGAAVGDRGRPGE